MRSDLKELIKEYQSLELPDELFRRSPNFIETPKIYELRMRRRDTLRKLIAIRRVQTPYKESIYLSLKKYKPITAVSKLLHLSFIHHWLEYDDTRYFDCARKICMICGHTMGTMLKRKYNAYERVKSGFLDLDELKAFIAKEIEQ